MASENISFIRLTCDRCGFAEDCKSTAMEVQWAKITTQYKSGDVLLPHGYSADLCPLCAMSLANWSRSPEHSGGAVR